MHRNTDAKAGRQETETTETPRSHHVIIGGTGRAGTTLLVQFFSALGLDTGFSAEEALREVDPHSNAGLERWLSEERRPYIIKNPRLSDEIEGVLASGQIAVDAAIIPMRDLFSAAESRRSVHRGASERGFNPLRQPGALWKTEKPQQQESHLALQFYRFVYPLVAHGVPIYFLEFPRFANDADYLVGVLEPLLSAQGVDVESARSAFSRVVRPELISDFKSPSDTMRPARWRSWLAGRGSARRSS